MDKIYSRQRLKIPSLKRITKIKISLLLCILGLLIFLVGFVIAIYPIFEETCKNKAESIGTDITTKEISKVMTNFNYDDLIYIERGKEGEITFIKAKIVPINQIISEIAGNIKSSIDKTEKTVIEVNIGKVTGIGVLSSIGPRCNIKVETSRTE